MAWMDDNYIRTLLDAREKWVTVLSVTAVAGSLVFLANHPHHSWLNLAPLAIGAFGSFYILVVNCYNEQAQALADAKEIKADESMIKGIRDAAWITFASRIGCLGWINIIAPISIGTVSTAALYFGLLPSPPKSQCG